MLRTERRAVHARDDQAADAAALEGKGYSRELPAHDQRLEQAAGLVTVLGRELDAAMGEVDRERAQDVTAAFGPLTKRAATLDGQIARLEAAARRRTAERVGVVTALAWSDPADAAAAGRPRTGRGPARAEAEEAERNEQAREHAAEPTGSPEREQPGSSSASSRLRARRPARRQPCR